MQIKQNIIKYIVILLSILNLVWLFGFEYRMPFAKRSLTEETVAASTAASAEEAVEEQEKSEENEENKEEEEEAAEGETAEEKASEGETAEEEASEEVVRCRVRGTNRLNVRSGPGTSYDIVGTAARGEVFFVLGVESGWVHVRNEAGVEGYVSENYIEILEEVSE